MDDCGYEYGLMYKGGGKGWDVDGYVSSSEIVNLCSEIKMFNMWKRYVDNIRKYVFVFDTDIVDNVSLEMPNTI